MRRYYPVFLDLRDRPCVVVGGGAVAEEKVDGLLQAAAAVTVIAPRLSPALRRHVERREISHHRREYRDGDLEGAYLVVAERIDPGTDRRLYEEAETRGIPVNVQDDVEHCSFIAPSIVRQGDLTVAISTAGQAPALAVRLRQRFERELGEEYARFLDLAGRLRAPLAHQVPGFEERRQRWYRLVDSEVLELLARGKTREARDLATEIMGVSADRDAENAGGATS